MNESFSRLVGQFLIQQQTKEERAKLVQRVLVTIGIICAIGLILVSTRAHATDIPLHVLDKDGIEIRLMDKPCVDPRSVLVIRPDALPRFKAVQSFWPTKDGSRKEFAGCWAELTAQESGSDEGFLVVFADGESGFIPKSEFRKVRGQVGA